MTMTFIKVTIGIMLLCSTYAIRLHGPQSDTTKDGAGEGSNEVEDHLLKRPHSETSKAGRPGDDPSSKTSEAGPGEDLHRRPPPSLVPPPGELPPAETSKPGPEGEPPSKTSDAGPGEDLHRPPPPSLVEPPEESPSAGTSKPGPKEDPSSETSEAGPGEDYHRRPPPSLVPPPDELPPAETSKSGPEGEPPSETSDAGTGDVPENIHCFRTKVTCGSNCTQNGGKCMRNGTACCKRKGFNQIPSADQDTSQQSRPSPDNINTGEDGVPENIHCFRTKVTCGSNCTQNGGKCIRNGTACCRKDFNQIPSLDQDTPQQSRPSPDNINTGEDGVPGNSHCFRTKVTCGSNCTQNGGRCMRNGTACCKRKDLNQIPSSDQDTPQQSRPSPDNIDTGEDGVPENSHCFRTKVTCGSNCTQNGGKCMRNGTACCKRKDLNQIPSSDQDSPQQSIPENIHCFRTKVTCGSNCTQNGGKCMRNGTACCRKDFNQIPSSDQDTPQQNIHEERRCVPTKGTCGSNCTQNGGRCVRNGTVCCHNKDEDDKNNLVRDGGAAETGAEDIADNADATVVDEGMTLRCTKAKCNKKCTESRGGFCVEGKCCYKKTENEAQSRCAKEKQHVLKGRPIVAGPNTHDEHLHCTVGGSYLARCQGQECHCLNAGSGERIGKPKKVTSLDKIDCDKEQNKTKPKRIRIKVKLSDNPLSAYSQSEKDAMKSALRDNLEKKYPVDAEIELYDGSVMANVNLGLCSDDCAATAQTTDLFSISTAVVSEINEGSILFEVNGETIIPSDAAIKDIQTAEMLQNLEKEMTETLEESEKEMMVTIITVTAVVVVVMFVLGLAVACYCSSNKKTKYVIEEKGGIYDDFKGKDNPSYIYHLEGGR